MPLLSACNRRLGWSLIAIESCALGSVVAAEIVEVVVVAVVGMTQIVVVVLAAAAAVAKIVVVDEPVDFPPRRMQMHELNNWACSSVT